MNENETTETENLSVWNKKPQDLTIGEMATVQTAYTAGYFATLLAVPALAYLAVVGVQNLRKKLKDRKKAKLELVEDNDE